ncbi:MAG: hypothetical protein HUU35_06600, partial [Armatimonadetes bacterium]|nr:hypothetical protein [Armatimonadota bacterium]
MKSRATGWVGIALGLLPVWIAGGADEPLGPVAPAAAAAAPEGQPESPDS